MREQIRTWSEGRTQADDDDPGPPGRQHLHGGRPSGAGKSTLVNALLARDPGIELSISYTTRAPRPGETSGREYHFTDAGDFLARRGRGRVPRVGRGARPLLRHLAAVDRAAARHRPRRPARDRLAGARQVRKRAAAGDRHLHPAAVDRGTRGPAAQAWPGLAAGDRPPAAGRRRRDLACLRVRLRDHQRELRSGAGRARRGSSPRPACVMRASWPATASCSRSLASPEPSFCCWPGPDARLRMPVEKIQEHSWPASPSKTA